MIWIESHLSLRGHPKMLRLAGMLSLKPVHACGHLHWLWWWAMEYADDGKLAGFTDPEIAYAAGWDGDAAMFVQALRDCDWIDETPDGPVLHDWWDYAGKLVARRQANRERMRQARAAHVQDTSATRAARTQTRAGATVPNPTVPNPTLPNQPTTVGADAPPISLADALVAARNSNAPAVVAAWAHRRWGSELDRKTIPRVGRLLKQHPVEAVCEAVIATELKRPAGDPWSYVQRVCERARDGPGKQDEAERMRQPGKYADHVQW